MRSGGRLRIRKVIIVKLSGAKKAWNKFITTINVRLLVMKKKCKFAPRSHRRQMRCSNSSLAPAAVVYVDDLYHNQQQQLPTTTGVKQKVVPEEYYNYERGSATSSGGVLQLEGVDLRAEIFIARFREEMRLQRHLADYQ